MMRTTIAIVLAGAAALSVMTLGGCASKVDRDYGKAVRQMMAAQVDHPETLRLPLGGTVEGVYPDSAKAAIDALRKDTAERTHTEQPVIFTYGVPSGGSNQ